MSRTGATRWQCLLVPIPPLLMPPMTFTKRETDEELTDQDGNYECARSHLVPGTAEYVQAMRDRLDGFCSREEGSGADVFWADIQEEAMLAANDEPLLASFLFATILNQKSLQDAIAFHLANKLASPTMPSILLMQLIQEAMLNEEVVKAVRHDLLAIMERDPACTRFMDPFLYYKGFHALEAYRVAHWLWNQGRQPLASYMQSQISLELQVDIHPKAQIGYGVFIDHATGVVIGETTVVGNNVSLLHQVTLGGSGMNPGARHPKIGDGVLIGAGSSILGNIHIGEGCIIGAGSLVLSDLPPHVTAVVSFLLLHKPSFPIDPAQERYGLVHVPFTYPSKEQDHSFQSWLARIRCD